MKTVHILSHDDKYGSAKSFLELLEKETQSMGIQPYVIVPQKNKIWEYCTQKHIPCVAVYYPQFQIPKNNSLIVFILKYLYRFVRYQYEKPLALKKLSKIIQEEKPDVIHTNSSVINIGAELNRIYCIPHVWHLREFGKEDYNFHSVKKNHIAYMNKYTTRFIAISQAVKDIWIKKGIDPQKIEVICHGVDAKKFAHVALPSHSKLPIRLVMCGSFGPAKGQLKVLEALVKLAPNQRAQVTMDFYGNPSGGYYTQFCKRVDKFNLNPLVRVKGYASNLPKSLPLYDAAIMYSRAEAMGRVTIEYMLAGLCPIVPRRGANIELIEENGCGLLFDYEDPSSLTKILQQVIANPNILETYAKKAYKVSREKYDSNKNIPHIIELFKSVAKH